MTKTWWQRSTSVISKPYQVFNLTGHLSRLQKNFTIVAGYRNLFDVRSASNEIYNGYNGYLSSAASPIGRAFNTRITYTFY